jgi:hypothetical protein
MAGLGPAIHVFLVRLRLKTWMPATGAGMTPSPENRAVFRKRDMNPGKNKLWDSWPESRSCFADASSSDSWSPCDERDAGRRPDVRLHGQRGLPAQPPVSEQG